ncbi:MAG: 30S ribosome-binding factor RbfA [Pseudomonadales bacterium]|jgi:ribosome-binding factor A|nr:30S ribosome-binding factor RbfA [Pseudomonadales bacterium]
MLAVSRDLKVADFIRDEVARIIAFEMRDPRVGSFVSVNDVKVSKDLSYAEIYVSSLQVNEPAEQEALIKVLNGAAGFFRSTLAKRHKMRTTPKPRFHYDLLVAEGPRIEKLIGTAMASVPANDSDEDAPDG